MATRGRLAFTAKGRQRKSIQMVVESENIDPENLTYTEHKPSRTAKVTDGNGDVRGRFRW